MEPRLLGWLLAHRLLLAHFFQRLNALQPQEAEPEALADTLTYLQQSVPNMLLLLPPLQQVKAGEAAAEELRLILTAWNADRLP